MFLLGNIFLSYVSEPCSVENNIDYRGNDDQMPGGKLKCSSPINTICSHNTPVTDVDSCKLFCGSSKYVTWKDRVNECFCKHSDLGRHEQSGSVSGLTNCAGQ